MGGSYIEPECHLPGGSDLGVVDLLTQIQAAWLCPQGH